MRKADRAAKALIAAQQEASHYRDCVKSLHIPTKVELKGAAYISYAAPQTPLADMARLNRYMDSALDIGTIAEDGSGGNDYRIDVRETPPPMDSQPIIRPARMGKSPRKKNRDMDTLRSPPMHHGITMPPSPYSMPVKPKTKSKKLRFSDFFDEREDEEEEKTDELTPRTPRRDRKMTTIEAARQAHRGSTPAVGWNFARDEMTLENWLSLGEFTQYKQKLVDIGVRNVDDLKKLRQTDAQVLAARFGMTKSDSQRFHSAVRSMAEPDCSVSLRPLSIESEGESGKAKKTRVVRRKPSTSRLQTTSLPLKSNYKPAGPSSPVKPAAPSSPVKPAEPAAVSLLERPDVSSPISMSLAKPVVNLARTPVPSPAKLPVQTSLTRSTVLAKSSKETIKPVRLSRAGQLKPINLNEETTDKAMSEEELHTQVVSNLFAGPQRRTPKTNIKRSKTPPETTSSNVKAVDDEPRSSTPGTIEVPRVRIPNLALQNAVGRGLPNIKKNEQKKKVPSWFHAAMKKGREQQASDEESF